MRTLGILLCCVSAVACSTNKPADGPHGSATAATMADDERMRPASSDSVDAQQSDPARRADDPFRHDSAATPGPSTGPGSSSTTSTSSTGTAAHKDTTSGAATGAADRDATGSAATRPDNTKVNQRDTKAATPTPMDQGESQSDLDITKRIRQSVMGDKSLSFTAKNVKIITRDGKVVLRGPVNSAEERASIEAAALKVAGAGNVDNQLEVKK